MSPPRLRPFIYDDKCEEIARYFLPADATEETIKELSQEIQDTVEDFISNLDIAK